MSRFKHDDGVARRVYDLHVRDGLTFAQIAERMGWTRNAVAGLYDRTKKRFQMIESETEH